MSLSCLKDILKIHKEYRVYSRCKDTEECDYSFFVFSFDLGLGDIAVMYMESRQRIETIKEGIAKGLDPIEIHQYSSNTKYAACYLLPDVYDDSTLWPNYDIAAYYGAPAIVGIPPVEDFGS